MQKSNAKKDNIIGIVGLGPRTGVSLVKYLCSKDFKVLVFDEKHELNLSKSLDALKGLKFEYEFGRKRPDKLFRAKTWIVSPGVSADKHYIKDALSLDIEVISEIEYASRNITSPLIAISGSAGKSTTVGLLGHILRAWQRRVFVGGNLGNPLIEATSRSYDFVVAEISSFQLELVRKFRPYVAGLTNIYPNHLDRHGSFQVYKSCKSRLFENMSIDDTAFINLDDVESVKSTQDISACKKYFSMDKKEESSVYLDNKNRLCLGSEKVDLRGYRLLGEHNVYNAMLAAGIAYELGCPIEYIQKGILSFHPLPHRLELVSSFDDVRYINDSKSTSPHSTIQALRSFSQPVVLLAGGRPKVRDFQDLASLSKERVRKAIFFGEAAKVLSRDFESIDHVVVSTLHEAMREAVNIALPGDCVLFSPANTSFDQFQDFEERGDIFKQLVFDAKEERLM